MLFNGLDISGTRGLLFILLGLECPSAVSEYLTDLVTLCCSLFLLANSDILSGQFSSIYDHFTEFRSSKQDKKGLTIVASQNACALHCPEILAEQHTAFFHFSSPALLTIQYDSQTAEVVLLFDVVSKLFNCKQCSRGSISVLFVHFFGKLVVVNYD